MEPPDPPTGQIGAACDYLGGMSLGHMTTTRAVILLFVLVVVLFGISIALSSRPKTANPKATWLQKLAPSRKFDPVVVVSTNEWKNGRWTIPKGVREAALDIGPSKNGQTIRRAKLTVEGNGAFQVEFRPRPAPADPGKFADPEASVLRIKSVKADQAPTELTILKNGGALVIRRTVAAAPAVFKLE